MNNLLNANHYSLSIIKDIEEICTPIKDYGISCFSYIRQHNDGSIFTLITNSDLYQHHCKNEYVLTPEFDQIKKKTPFYHISICNENDQYSQALYDYKNLFNVHHPLFLAEASGTYIDYFVFSHQSAHTSQVINSYMNNLTVFEKFKSHFLVKAAALIANSNKNRIILPKHMLNNFNYANNVTSIYKQKILLTFKQKVCLSLLLKGKTAKEIGRTLNISYRTVEHRIEALKMKFNCKYKGELIEKVQIYLIQHPHFFES